MAKINHRVPGKSVQTWIISPVYKNPHFSKIHIVIVPHQPNYLQMLHKAIVLFFILYVMCMQVIDTL
jgi:hypothetical protein